MESQTLLLVVNNTIASLDVASPFNVSNTQTLECKWKNKQSQYASDYITARNFSFVD